MTQFDKHDDLPYDAHCHLLSLESWIGGLDGEEISDGTITAEDAVKAVNALIAATRYLMGQRDRLRRVTPEMIGAAKARLSITQCKPDGAPIELFDTTIRSMLQAALEA